MTTYQKRVESTMAALGTTADEWQAYPFGPDGTQILDGIDQTKRAPGPFANHAMAAGLGDCQCELCGQSIKRIYHLHCDSKAWRMVVGSECVTHFAGGESGEELSNAARVEATKKTIRSLMTARRTILEELVERINTPYGRMDCYWTSNDARSLVERISNILGRTDCDSSPAALTRWEKRNREGAEEILSDYRSMMTSPLIVAHMHSRRRSRVIRADSALARAIRCGPSAVPACERELAEAKAELEKFNQTSK